MKQTISLILALCLTLALTACGGTVSTPEPALQSVTQDEAPAAAPQAESNAVPQQPASAEHKTMVVYFSHTGENYTVGTINTGNTAIVGDWIAERFCFFLYF